MSGQSPAVVLYSSDGVELNVVSGNVVPTSTRALLISGQNPSGDALYVPSAAQGALGIVNMSNDYIVQSNATVTTSGSTFVTANYYGTQEIAIIVNVGTVTGSGSITYTIQEVDPGNNTTLFGNSASTSAISTGNAPAVFTAVLNSTTSPVVRVSWVVTGTFSASIYTTVVSKTTPVTQAVSGTVTATNPSVSTVAAAPPTSATYVGALVTTAAESGLTTGDMYPFNLTTAGQLRIDGVYPTAAAAPSTDAMYVAGAVTTAAPTYTTGQMDPLSLDTSGNLRTSVNNTVTVTGAASSTFNNQSVGTDAAAALGFDTQVGGKTTTAAPTYTTGNLDALSLTTLGGLRIDGVYAAGTPNATAADVTNSGGYVTTSAPTYATGQLQPLSLDVFGNLRVTALTNKATTSSVTSVAVTASAATQLLAANTSPRIFASLYNNTNKSAYILYGTGTASATNFSIVLLPQSYLEIPVDWTGVVSEFSPSGASGNFLCTELTP
jgi:hypothetical protein